MARGNIGFSMSIVDILDAHWTRDEVRFPNLFIKDYSEPGVNEKSVVEGAAIFFGDDTYGDQDKMTYLDSHKPLVFNALIIPRRKK